MAMLSAIIFDFDGVIADTEPLHFAGFRQTLAEIGIGMTESDFMHQSRIVKRRIEPKQGEFETILANRLPMAGPAVAPLFAEKGHNVVGEVQRSGLRWGG